MPRVNHTQKILTLLILSTIFNAQAIASTSEAAEKLDWMLDQHSICKGHYQTPRNIPDALVLTQKIDSTETYIQSDYPVRIQKNNWSEFDHITVTQIGRKITADKARVYRDPRTGETTTLVLEGNIHFYEPNRHLASRKATFNLLKETGMLKYSFYRIYAKTPTGYHNIQGKAKILRRIDANHWSIEKGSYSTCPPVNPAWQLKAKHIHLNKKIAWGVARNAKLFFKNMPILYFPYFTFPLNHKRKSGFLVPTIGSSKKLGFNAGIPYYFNLAPNYDATLSTLFSAKRGLLLKGLFRYLTPQHKGRFLISTLPSDREFKKFRQQSQASQFAGSNRNYINGSLANLKNSASNRTYFHMNNNSQINKHWSSSMHLNYVTDDYYFQDIGTRFASADKDQLLNRFKLAYEDPHWNFSTLVQAYQTLHPLNEPVTVNQYERLPELNLNGHFFDPKTALNYQIQTGFVHFRRTRMFGTNLFLPQGNRVHINPSIIWQKLFPSGFFKPQLQLDLTAYNLTNQPIGFPTKITRTLPLFNVDTGLYFDRSVQVGDTPYTQTLEPRLFYLYAPMRNQNSIPLFDTTLPAFSFNQLFRTNRFVGLDRISDANQVTLGLVSRLLDGNNGREKLQAGIGQIYYFKSPRVCLTPRCINDFATTDHTSPLIGNVSYHLNQHWHASADAAWDMKRKRMNNSQMNFYYHPTPHALFNVGYEFIRNTTNTGNTDQIKLSSSIAVKQHWNVVGSWYYNTRLRHVQSYLYGLEYNSCCFAWRVIASNELIWEGQNLNQPNYDKRYYVQFQLKGLGNFGQDQAGKLLTTHIAGYHDKIFGN